MDGRIAFGRDDLDCCDVPILSQLGIDKDVGPLIHPRPGQDIVFRQGNNQVGFAVLPELPPLLVGEGARRRQVGRISPDRAAVHPAHDGRDFLVGQRRIVAEMLDTDVLVDKPRRHFASHNFHLDRSSPRPHLLVSHERHRRKRVRPMAHLTTVLQNWRYVFGEGDFHLGRLRRRGRRLARRRNADDAYRQCQRSRKDETHQNPSTSRRELELRRDVTKFTRTA